LLEAETPGAGTAFLCRLVEAFREIGVWECIGPAGYRRIRDNLSSVLLPYGAFKSMLGRRGTGVPPVFVAQEGDTGKMPVPR
jgi:hypothetical protein